jgi:colanic acid biosynthesis glycosyl transferase WcaI
LPRIVFVNRYFYPDLSATAQILGDLAFHLASSGVQVVVITGRRPYVDTHASLPKRERIRGVEIIRVSTTGFGRMGLRGRAADYLTFHVLAFLTLLRELHAGDIVVAKTDPPLISVATAIAAAIRRARQVNWLQDLFPEVALVIEPTLLSKPVALIARKLRDWSLRRAEVNVVPGRIMASKLADLGIPGSRLRIIANWADDRVIRPVPRDANPVRQEWNLSGKFVVAYSGNLGRAHEFVTMLDAARRLLERADLAFVVIGGGAQMEDVRQLCQKYGLTNVQQFPYQPRERLHQSLSAGDLHVISLIPELEGLVVPSKFYGIAAARRPIAYIGDENGEIGELVTRHQCGRCFAVGDDAGLAAFIMELAGDLEKCGRMGDNARNVLDAEWSQAMAFERWRGLLAAIEGPRVSTSQV